MNTNKTVLICHGKGQLLSESEIDAAMERAIEEELNSAPKEKTVEQELSLQHRINSESYIKK